MAKYTYKCSNEECDIYNILLEIEHPMVQDTIRICPDCGKETFGKVITSVPGFRSVVNGLYRFRPGKSN